MTVHRFPGASRAIPPASAVRPAPGEINNPRGNLPDDGHGIVAALRRIEGDSVAEAWRQHVMRQGFIPEEPVDLTPPPARPVDHAREYLRSFRRAPVGADRFDRVMWWAVLVLCGAGAVSVIVTMAQVQAVLP